MLMCWFINSICFYCSDLSPTWTRVRGETRQVLFNLCSVHGPTKPSRQRDERVKKVSPIPLVTLLTIATEWKSTTDVSCSFFTVTRHLHDPQETLARGRCFIDEALTNSRVQPVPSLQPWTPWSNSPAKHKERTVYSGKSLSYSFCSVGFKTETICRVKLHGADT